MNIIILGGNFKNNGAAAMLYITAQIMHQKYPIDTIYYASPEKPRIQMEKIYNVEYMYRYNLLNALGLGHGMGVCKFVRYKVIDFIRCIKRHDLCRFFERLKRYEDILDETRCILDISGYALSSRFRSTNYIASDYYLDFIEYAKERCLKVFLMPQSFGPFDYGLETAQRLKRIVTGLSRADLIFAREKECYDVLAHGLGLNNIICSDDLVLQVESINYPVLSNEFQIETKCNNVAIVPNIRLLETIAEQRLMSMYMLAINEFINMGKTVYIVAHSDEDIDLYNKMKATYGKENAVRFLEIVDFAQFDHIVGKFDYVVSSRYHSIIHAYRHGIPCICIGWAEKYTSLLKRFGQMPYMIDVADITENKIRILIEKMEVMHKNEASHILENIREIQKKNCFEKVFEYMSEG